MSVFSEYLSNARACLFCHSKESKSNREQIKQLSGVVPANRTKKAESRAASRKRVLSEFGVLDSWKPKKQA